MKIYHVDAFTDRLFAGNPAAVCLMDEFPADQVMQNIARENRLSETAYLVPDGEDRYRLRWFTPGGEIDLCGHATLASGFVVLNYCHQSSIIHFITKSGELTVSAVGDHYQMSFPSYKLKEVPVTPEMTAVFGVKPVAAYLDRDLLCVLPTADAVRNYHPDADTSPSCRDSSKTLRLPAMTRSTTAYPVALRPNWPSSKTQSLGVPTARLPRIGRTSWARRRLLPSRLRRGPGPSIVKRLATASSCPVTRFYIQLANCNCSHCAFLNHNERE